MSNACKSGIALLMCDVSKCPSVAPHDAGGSDVQLDCDDALLEQLASGSATVNDVTSALSSGWEPNRAEPGDGRHAAALHALHGQQAL